MSVIELNDVSVTFHEGGRTVEAVKHVNISVEKGEIFGIVGFSGAGKSTLVRTINLLERPTGGHVVIDGSDITALKGGQLRDLRKKIGFIFQGFNLITNVTVGKNIEFALKASGYPKAQWSARIRELLALVGLENKIDSYPSSLSGGQKQRVSIARALANKPEILLSMKLPAHLTWKPRKAFWRFCNASTANWALPSCSSRISLTWRSRFSTEWPLWKTVW